METNSENTICRSDHPPFTQARSGIWLLIVGSAKRVERWESVEQSALQGRFLSLQRRSRPSALTLGHNVLETLTVVPDD